jgi:hypothetical protein
VSLQVLQDVLLAEPNATVAEPHKRDVAAARHGFHRRGVKPEPLCNLASVEQTVWISRAQRNLLSEKRGPLGARGTYVNDTAGILGTPVDAPK